MMIADPPIQHCEERRTKSASIAERTRRAAYVVANLGVEEETRSATNAHTTVQRAYRDRIRSLKTRSPFRDIGRVSRGVDLNVRSNHATFTKGYFGTVCTR
jgi:hypothetical protein